MWKFIFSDSSLRYIIVHDSFFNSGLLVCITKLLYQTRHIQDKNLDTDVLVAF